LKVGSYGTPGGGSQIQCLADTRIWVALMATEVLTRALATYAPAGAGKLTSVAIRRCAGKITLRLVWKDLGKKGGMLERELSRKEIRVLANKLAKQRRSRVSETAKQARKLLSELGRVIVRRKRRSGLDSFSRASEFGILPYGFLKKLTKNTGLHAHHLIERRFADTLGRTANSMKAIALTPAEHQPFTNDWRRLIPLGQGTRTASPQQILNAARQIYKDFPDILKALGL